MEEITRIKDLLEERGYRSLDNVSCSIDVRMKKGVQSCNPILEVFTSESFEIKEILEKLEYKVMIRDKKNGVSQLLLKK